MNKEVKVGAGEAVDPGLAKPLVSWPFFSLNMKNVSNACNACVSVTRFNTAPSIPPMKADIRPC